MFIIVPSCDGAAQKDATKFMLNQMPDTLHCYQNTNIKNGKNRLIYDS